MEIEFQECEMSLFDMEKDDGKGNDKKDFPESLGK